MARGVTSALRRFLDSEATGGMLLIAAAALALVAANSGLAAALSALCSTPRLGPLTVHLWINDALMALFFLLVGLEIKREFLDGDLATWERRRLPLIAAAAGMAVPACSISPSPAAIRCSSAAGRSRRRPTSPSRSACSPCSAAARRRR